MATNQNGDEYIGDEFSREEIEAAQRTAYALGQLRSEERAEVERMVGAGGEAARGEIGEIESIASAVSAAQSAGELPITDGALRDRIERELSSDSLPKASLAKVELAKRSKWLRWPSMLEWCVIGGTCCVFAALLLPALQMAREASRQTQASNDLKQLGLALQNQHDASQSMPYGARPRWEGAVSRADSIKGRGAAVAAVPAPGFPGGDAPGSQFHSLLGDVDDSLAVGDESRHGGAVAGPGGMQGGGASPRRALAVNDHFRAMSGSVSELPQLRNPLEAGDAEVGQRIVAPSAGFSYFPNDRWPESLKTGEQYDRIVENAFLSPLEQPLSTFSIDVDTASYANMRRFLTSGRLPPRNSVRIEELVNYFRYEYSAPGSRTAGETPALRGEAGETPALRGTAGETPAPRNDPFSVNMEVAECPWAPGTLTPALSQGEREKRRGHLLLRVGIKGKDVHRSERPASNLVFLLDVSGSMSDENKLPLLKTAMKLLVGELGENDRVSIVTYAGDAGLKLRSTRGDQQQRITRAIDSLQSGGSTNGSAGIELAYEQATANFIPGGANRVILCTDGDLNVGITSDEALTRLIKQKAKSGVFLTVLGFGEGNLKDAKMEKLADNGNGLYAYIDSVREARKVLVEQLTGSTITIAKDVKIQIEFNPAQIAVYRLLGYENRVLAAEDFNNDKKDAGEIGAGHTVTALYEIVPVGEADEAAPRQPGTDPLKYQNSQFRIQNSEEKIKSGELLTLKLRYKEPEGETSRLLEYPLKDRGHSFHSASPDFQFAAAVAGFGMILRGSQHRGSATLDGVAEIAAGALGKDEGGYRAEFVDLVRKAQALGAK